MASTQNLTVRLASSTVRKARRVAAQRGTSISALVAEKIAEVAGEDDAYEAARRHAIGVLEDGFPLGGQTMRRDDLHRR